MCVCVPFPLLSQAASLKKDVSMQITLKELLNVKLNKRQSSLGIDKVCLICFHCHITNSELYRIALKHSDESAF